ncbi:lipocalin-like domain-containing protein [Ruegeria arenilitoris]|uniref:c-type cytochrome n=1 Tax=Ruegeria arenilitoris TaxID=1173585 RepID=UPI00147E5CAC|nr:lipocalin-like domain-containing protein [Ruegeria arenilitoris]
MKKALLELPEDHGAHVNSRTETWQLLTHLSDEDGNKLGFQFLFLRIGIAPPTVPPQDSIWDVRQLERVHVALLDANSAKVAREERFGRGIPSISGFDWNAAELRIDNWFLRFGDDSTQETLTLYAPDIRAFIASLQAPVFPYPVDVELAAEGEGIFLRECSACHGTYGANETFLNRVYPVSEIGTDPAYATEATDGSRDRFYAWVARSPYGDTESANPAPGYIAPPLDGIWATAPYLHNGSVPNMEALLLSILRPMYWRHLFDPRNYDPQTMGWRFEVLSAGQESETDPNRRRMIYDTTLRGYGNQGHTYSDELSDKERSALLEYLKTI